MSIIIIPAAKIQPQQNLNQISYGISNRESYSQRANEYRNYVFQLSPLRIGERKKEMLHRKVCCSIVFRFYCHTFSVEIFFFFIGLKYNINFYSLCSRFSGRIVINRWTMMERTPPPPLKTVANGGVNRVLIPLQNFCNNDYKYAIKYQSRQLKLKNQLSQNS